MNTKPNEKARILAIDDNPSNLILLASSLNKNFALQLATSGRSGILMAESNPPDLILLDVMMPDMDGFETCRRIKSNPRLRAIPIMFVTAVNDPDFENKALSLGANDFIYKPLNVELATKRISGLVETEALKKALSQNARQPRDAHESPAQPHAAGERVKSEFSDADWRACKTCISQLEILAARMEQANGAPPRAAAARARGPLSPEVRGLQDAISLLGSKL